MSFLLFLLLSSSSTSSFSLIRLSSLAHPSIIILSLSLPLSTCPFLLAQDVTVFTNPFNSADPREAAAERARELARLDALPIAQRETYGSTISISDLPIHRQVQKHSHKLRNWTDMGLNLQLSFLFSDRFDAIQFLPKHSNTFLSCHLIHVI